MKLDDSYKQILRELEKETPVPELYEEDTKQEVLYRIRRLEDEGYITRRDERKRTVAERSEKGDLWLKNNDLEKQIKQLEGEIDEIWEALEDRILGELNYIVGNSENLEYPQNRN